MSRLRVGFDAGPLLDPVTGVGRYTQELARALEARDVDLRRFAVSLGGRAPSGVRRLRVPARLAQASWRRWDRPGLGRLTGEVDLVHGTNFVLPPTGGRPGVVTVHDLSFSRDDTFPGGERLRDLVPWSVKRATKVLTPTQAVALEVSERLGVPSEDIHVTPEGVAAHFFGATPLSSAALADMGVFGPYAVAVGTIEPRKNLPALLDAWERSGVKDFTLVLAGPPGWGPRLRPAARVVPVGRVEEASLPGLLAGAELFCYPSLYEGFGLPPLEAMAAGTPALVGRYPAAAEVVGDAAVLVDPGDVEEMAAALARLASDDALRRRYSLVGRARAALFTWDRTAGATLDAYHSATKA